MAYVTLEVEATVIRWRLGIQQFLSEEAPPHLCHMFYTDSKIATVGFNIETNTKDCKLKPHFLDKFTLHFSNVMDDKDISIDEEIQEIPDNDEH